VKAPRARPNFVVILTDDQGAWAMGCAGNPEIRTPSLDRLAAEGTRFDNFFCASPVCSPARASLLTGRIPSQHGIHDWIRRGNAPIEYGKPGALIEYLAGITACSDVLAAAGYRCGLSGKWHLGDATRPQKGFSFWRVHAQGGGPYYGAPMLRGAEVYAEPRYVTDVITENALAFLDEAAVAATPFYLGVHYTAPHSPWDRGNHPAELYDEYLKGCPFASIPRDPMHPWQIASAPSPWTPGNTREGLLAGYFAAVTAMDAGVGRILQRLEGLGLRESTVVLFTGDNGMNMGHHGIFGKGNGTFPQNMYDTSVKVPAVAALPGVIPAGRVCSELLTHCDVMPTLLELAGLDCPDAGSLAGRSFADLLGGGTGGLPAARGAREQVFVCDEYGPVRMIRDRRWKYVHRYPYGPHELYDLAADPQEKSNLAHQPGHDRVIADLKGRLEEWFHRYVDPARDGVREAVTGAGQIGLAGPAGRGEPAFSDDWRYMAEARGRTAFSPWTREP
jgi:arylsulfatase A-like enzyme